MKLVIDIPKDMYESIKQLKIQYPRGSAKANQLDFYYGLLNCLKQGIPLPKGHGDLADKQSIVNQIANTNFWLSADMWSELMEAIKYAPTIIEADKESD